MKKLMILVTLMVLVSLTGCASLGYNMQKGAAIGAAAGAGVGQWVGQSTSATLIGGAVGALVGAIGGNAVDQYYQNKQPAAVASVNEPPPGKWVTQPGQWSGGRWVPGHSVWQPINPGRGNQTAQAAPVPAQEPPQQQQRQSSSYEAPRSNSQQEFSQPQYRRISF